MPQTPFGLSVQARAFARDDGDEAEPLEDEHYPDDDDYEEIDEDEGEL